MEIKSRSYFAIKNSLIGLINKVIVISLTFASRTVFIKILGSEYLGINGLYSDILSILSLAELGIGNAMIYSLYKPLANNDTKNISRLMNFYKHIYHSIAITVLFLGLCLIPFLKYIVNSTFSNSDIMLFYIFYLINSVTSYLAIYKSTLIKAKQENYIIETIMTITKTIVTIIQILVLVIFKNFIIYLIIMLLGTLIQNILITIEANKRYDFTKSEGNLTNKEKKIIINDIKSVFIYKIGQVIINYTDSILMSIILSTTYVGYYSNYSMIIMQITSIIGIITTSIIASIGNLATENNHEKSYKVFNELVFFFHILTSFCTICFISIFNDFITIWIGEDNLLSQWAVIAISLNFYIQNIINPVWMYREAFGLFKQIKYVMLMTAGINILLSIVFGRIYGIGGIIISTGLARLLTTVWYEPIILHKQIFRKSVWKYYIKQCKYFICTIISYFIVSLITDNMNISINTVFIKIVVSFLSVLFIFSLLNINNTEYISLNSRIKKILKIK